jgi:hypothetical protein
MPMIRVGDRWLNPRHVIGAETLPEGAIRVYLLRGMAWTFTGPEAAQLAARLDLLDTAAAEPVRRPRDVSGRLEDEGPALSPEARHA